MPGLAQVVIQSTSRQALGVSVYDDARCATAIRLRPYESAGPFTYDRLTQQTLQLADAGHVTIRPVS